jgi:predicted enzyme related to lactoylglutathione lyase
MANAIVHVELAANDRVQAASWYADLFGWEYEDMPAFQYTTFRSGGNGMLGGGFNGVSDEYPAGTITFYIETDDVHGHLKRIEGKGGKVVSPPMPVPGVGQIAMFRDPTGNMVGLIQPEMAG